MLPNERLAYSAIVERPPLALPGGARLAVWVIVNVEEWDIRQTMPRTVLTPPAGGSPMPDIPNWAWHEYGNRVGFWRMLEVFDDFRIPGRARHQRLGDRRLRADRARRAAIATGSSSATASPRRTCRRWTNEAEDIARTTEAIARLHRPAAARLARARASPRPGRRPTCCVEAGYEYVCDWVLDDQPVALKTRARRRSSTCPTRRNATTSR